MATSPFAAGFADLAPATQKTGVNLTSAPKDNRKIIARMEFWRTHLFRIIMCFTPCAVHHKLIFTCFTPCAKNVPAMLYCRRASFIIFHTLHVLSTTVSNCAVLSHSSITKSAKALYCRKVLLQNMQNMYTVTALYYNMRKYAARRTTQ